MELNDKLLSLRTNNGYTTRDLAKKLEVSQSSISLWEKGERRPDMDKVKKLSALYGVSIDYLLGNENNETGIKNFNKLNEIRNSMEIDISRLQKQMNAVEKEISEIMRDIDIDKKYRNKITHNFSKNETIDNHIIDLVSDKIKEEESTLYHLQENREMINQKIKCSISSMQNIYIQLKEEHEREIHLTQTLELLEKKDFKHIIIDNEYELKVIILKYFEIYEVFKNSDLSIDEIIIRLKSSIKNHLFL